MADTKISALTALVGSGVDQTADVLPIVDTSATTTKKILVNQLIAAMNVNGTVADVSGGVTSSDLTIPTWATRVTVMLKGVSTNGTSPLIVQLGDAGGIETSGYVGTNTSIAASLTAFTSGFMLVAGPVAANTYDAVLELTMENPGSFQWMGQGHLCNTNSAAQFTFFVGHKATSQATTTVRLTIANGTDILDAGEWNVLYS